MGKLFSKAKAGGADAAAAAEHAKKAGEVLAAEAEKAKELFSSIDKDGSGSLSMEELKEAITTRGVEAAKEDGGDTIKKVYDMIKGDFAKYDNDKDKKLSLEEFISAFNDNMGKLVKEVGQVKKKGQKALDA